MTSFQLLDRELTRLDRQAAVQTATSLAQAHQAVRQDTQAFEQARPGWTIDPFTRRVTKRDRRAHA